ncbi:MFS transporter family glucose-6-phosphate receptor UhpC [Edwardsiella piscicida]|uniref:MFS transporter family glucose-6-phosphate receptor UhpC n=1 Tax=Edwardsiella piscicida TaxID=1263550 RepID=UPI0005A07316|nr:MFS transporter family glucose-6-phosphate receptor UhpC [Edwardsiella piscicida]EKS7779066.1 MFS transporter family glucose-6-phosphate receptor UhpC [Edwardsiella piscicida]EKS7782486.1 MFS transporter family glucose-6-phosphate receptor UhpC [Edwardsiella piscicida]EKS7811929.1 MFS transporter family glucose-6-phosphate receptor UhpC [Edwardsiella piscicida]ELM3721793.1 MFS transporter family glucose-6-phosphate receptor UhpC [Edwardsiella piscicida]UCQ22295.1 MFS transporter family gluc
MHARPASAIDPIDQRYRTLRSRLWIGMALGYAAFYLTRKSVNYVLPALQTDLGLDKGSIGLLGSLFYLTYGLSKFAAGLWHDSHGQRAFMGMGLFATGALNVAFAFTQSLPLMLVIWTLNGFFQGWGWPPCARLLTHWYSRNERGFWWGSWNMSINLGGALMPLICAYAALRWGWQAAMLTPGIIGMILGIWLIMQLTGTPRELGLPSVGVWRNDPLELRQERQSPPMGLWQMLRTTVLKNPMIWLLGIAYVLVYLIRIALNDWGNIWLTESHGVNLLSANATVMLFEVGGLLGALFAGWGSDLLFRGQRAPMILLFTLGLMVSVSALWLVQVHHYALLAVCFFSVGFFVFGPQMLIGLAAVECGHKDAAGSITGFLGLFAYLGAALAGWPLSQIIERYGWSGMFSLLSIAAVLMVLLLMPLLMAGVTLSLGQRIKQ